VALGVIVLLANLTAHNRSSRSNASSTNAQVAVTNTVEPNSTPKDSDEIVADLISEANKDLAAGRPEAAVQTLRKAIEARADSEEAHYNLGIALAAAGKPAEARKEYEKALEIFPDYTEAHINLGNLLMNENQFTEAIVRFQKALDGRKSYRRKQPRHSARAPGQCRDRPASFHGGHSAQARLPASPTESCERLHDAGPFRRSRAGIDYDFTHGPDLRARAEGSRAPSPTRR
jgi:tetratricopeptide (TPR) repeat protein